MLQGLLCFDELFLSACPTVWKSSEPLEAALATRHPAGVSSCVNQPYAALVGVGSKKYRDYHLLDIKEATAAAAPRSPKARVFENHAERVVTGARALSPFLGRRMMATSLKGKPVLVRELRPQDMKFELNNLNQAQAIKTARLMAGSSDARMVGR